MDTLQERTDYVADTSRAGSLLHWHFRALPIEVQRGAIRRLALSGIEAKDIAARTGWPLDAVRRVLREDECVARLMPAHIDASGSFDLARNTHFTI